MMKRNEGFTLIELILSISIGTLITGAVLSVLLFGMRVNLKTTANVQQVNATNMLTQIVQSVAEEQEITVSYDHRTIENAQGFKLSFNGTSILLNGSVFMEDVSDFKAELSDDKKLLTITLKVNDKEYIAKTYCRLNQGGTADES